jgi:hypothetical protein
MTEILTMLNSAAENFIEALEEMEPALILAKSNLLGRRIAAWNASSSSHINAIKDQAEAVLAALENDQSLQDPLLRAALKAKTSLILKGFPEVEQHHSLEALKNLPTEAPIYVETSLLHEMCIALLHDTLLYYRDQYELMKSSYAETDWAGDYFTQLKNELYYEDQEKNEAPLSKLIELEKLLSSRITYIKNLPQLQQSSDTIRKLTPLTRYLTSQCTLLEEIKQVLREEAAPGYSQSPPSKRPAGMWRSPLGRPNPYAPLFNPGKK